MERINYIIADDHKVFREGVKTVLQDEPDFKLLAEVSSGTELIALLKSTVPHILLLDVKMPGLDGMEVTKLVKEQYPAVKILILTMYDDERTILHLMDIGANGYLVKNADPEEIVYAMRC